MTGARLIGTFFFLALAVAMLAPGCECRTLMS
jgi:hypothetical protein